MSYYLSRPIEIVAYDPQWPTLFEEEKTRLHAALGSTLIVVEHIGSTSVPQLGAKPILDILAAVESLERVSSFVPALQELGYEDARINPVFQRRLFCKGGYNEGTHHLHFVKPASEQWRAPLQFRDYLRAHPDEARRYEALKRQLAQEHGRDLNGYSDGKGPVIAVILAR